MPPGFEVFGPIVDLSTSDYLHCFKANALLGRAPQLGAPGTGVLTSNRTATVGQSFTRGSLALNGEIDIGSIVWLAKSAAQARSAFAALFSARITSCLRTEITQLRSSLGTPATVSSTALPAAVGLRVQTRAQRLIAINYDEASGTYGPYYWFDLTAARVGRMVALLETDSANVVSAPTTLPNAKRARLARILIDRMAREQGLHTQGL